MVWKDLLVAVVPPYVVAVDCSSCVDLVYLFAFRPISEEQREKIGHFSLKQNVHVTTLPAAKHRIHRLYQNDSK